MLNDKACEFIKSFSYTLISNLITLLISTTVVLIVPKLIGVQEYSYWQLYIFYSSYVGFLHFGWNDGIYLRYGGEEYNNLDKKLFFSQFIMLGTLQVIILLGVFFLHVGQDKQFILRMTVTCMLLVNLRGMIVYILQSTNKIREYVRVTILDRLLYIFLLLLVLICGERNYEYIIIVDLIGKFVSLVIAVLICRDMVFRRIADFTLNVKEAAFNISVGIKLMFSNIASMLVVGTVRFGIEKTWDVITFGKVSLTLSVSNLLMMFINAMGVILFPILRRTDKERLPSIYMGMRNFMMVVLLGMLVFYYPAKIAISRWLPAYADSLKYMALLFPMSVYEGKMALLVNTYLKTLRKEKLMLKLNVVSLLLSILMTLFSTIILKNLDLAVVSIVVLLAFRCILAEIILSKTLEIPVLKDTVMELVVTITFILTGWFISSIMTTLIYTFIYISYLQLKRNDISEMSKTIKQLLKH